MLFKRNSNETIYESTRILAKFPDKVPVIVETDDENIRKSLNKNKFLVPYDISVSYLLIAIRKQIKVNSSIAFFIFCDNKLLSPNDMMYQVYEEYKIRNNIGKNDNKFLYINIRKEQTFG
jgi:GABA(A) receptor-associated protein